MQYDEPGSQRSHEESLREPDQQSGDSCSRDDAANNQPFALTLPLRQRDQGERERFPTCQRTHHARARTSSH